jgi:hypothetical protein
MELSKGQGPLQKDPFEKKSREKGAAGKGLCQRGQLEMIRLQKLGPLRGWTHNFSVLRSLHIWMNRQGAA